jgi:hypothetical protein
MAEKQSQIIVFSKGAMLDIPAGMVPQGYCSDARHISFEDGICRKMPGFSEFYGTADANYINGLYSFTATSGTVYVLAGTKTSMYKIVNGSATPLTISCSGADTETVTYDATPWSFASFGSHILMTNGIDPVKKFISPYSALVNVGGSPPVANVVKVFQRHAFLLGMPTDPFTVRWSDIDDYENWSLSYSLTAGYESGDLTLYESATPVVGGEGLGDIFCVYTGNQIHIFQYIGGAYIFNRRIASWDVGLWKKNLVATGEGIQAFMSRTNFYSFDGKTVNPIGDPINKTIFAELDTSHMSQAFAFPNKKRGEIWFCVPILNGGGFPTLACVWNYRNGSWSFVDITGWAAATDRLVPYYPLFSPSNKKIYNLGNTENADGIAITGYIDSPEFGGDMPNSYKHIQEIYPSVYTTGTSLKFSIGTRDSVNASITWTSDYTFTPSTDQKVDISASGKLWRVRTKTNGVNTPFTLERLTVNWVLGGDR